MCDSLRAWRITPSPCQLPDFPIPLDPDRSARAHRPQWGIAVGITLCHRFFAVKSMKRNDRFVSPWRCWGWGAAAAWRALGALTLGCQRGTQRRRLVRTGGLTTGMWPSVIGVLGTPGRYPELGHTFPTEASPPLPDPPPAALPDPPPPAALPAPLPCSPPLLPCLPPLSVPAAQLIATACLFLAAKVEEAPRLLKTVIGEVERVRHSKDLAKQRELEDPVRRREGGGGGRRRSGREGEGGEGRRGGGAKGGRKEGRVSGRRGGGGGGGS